MKELTEAEALNKAAAYCSLTERCIYDVTEKLNAWGVDNDAKHRILTRLINEKFIDEKRFCRFFINDKFKFNKWGKIKIGQALYQKKIPTELSSQLLSEIDYDEYIQILRSLLAAKRRSTKAADEYQLNIKLMRFAAGRGFELEAIRKCIQMPDED